MLRKQQIIGLAILGMTSLTAFGLDYFAYHTREIEKTLNITRGVNIDPRDSNKIQEIVDFSSRNSAYRVIVAGHTGTQGDKVANEQLSKMRAEKVADLLRQAGLNHEIEIQAHGGSIPLAQEPGENQRSYQNRLSRVTVKLESPL